MAATKAAPAPACCWSVGPGCARPTTSHEPLLAQSRYIQTGDDAVAAKHTDLQLLRLEGGNLRSPQQEEQPRYADERLRTDNGRDVVTVGDCTAG